MSVDAMRVMTASLTLSPANHSVTAIDTAHSCHCSASARNVVGSSLFLLIHVIGIICCESAYTQLTSAAKRK